MSGGVDSSVTAKLLAQQDYDLSAVFMRNWDTRDESGTDTGCEWEKDWEDVQRVCRTLDIPCRMVDLSRDYWTRVFEPALKAWELGDTPNPDIWCNREVKFGALMDRLAENIEFLATGHYARKAHDPISLRPQLFRPLDRQKDQTYYLSSIPEASLSKAIFPLADLTKSDVREIAKQAGLHTASRDESMGICFVGEKRRFSDFLAEYIPQKLGHMIDLRTGQIVGEHRGLWAYTIGQGARVQGLPEKLFIARKDNATNEIWLAPGSHPALSASKITAKHWSWIWGDAPPLAIDTPAGLRARLQFRHRMLDVPCTVRRSATDAIEISFDEPQKAVAPGQIATVWDNDWCLGCGTISGVNTMDMS
ncbi:tRNA methyltransferase [Auriscalpium vulgare]|uniref:tRNA methyltransferase n=1 Tax=Auriscalpium vulgare TaxID=40419 RepID=A0ACB8SBN9_9AGAM|nr:tRNA methyltransferase [Auriscalpium vulgare]